MYSFTQNSIAVLENYQVIMTLLGIVLLFLEAILGIIFFEIIELFFKIIFSVPHYIRNAIIVVRYITANKKRRTTLLKLVYSVSVILALMVFSFKSHCVELTCTQKTILIFFGIVYILAIYKKLKELNKNLKIQYIKQRARIEYFNPTGIIDRTSYITFLLGRLIDEKKFVFWLTNLLFGLCAPISILAYVYLTFCDSSNLVSIVSIVSIVIALYSVWKTVDTNRETTKILNDLIPHITNANGYEYTKPDESNSNDWIN